MERTFRPSLTTIVSVPLDSDPRFTYSMLLPREMDADTRLLVSVHGSHRDISHALKAFAELANSHNVAVLAPHFPRFPDDDRDVLGYKMLRWKGIAYDDVLMSMIAESRAGYAVPQGRFALAGYSGGGQFAQRFALFHARELLSVSIGAPGRVTLPDVNRAWWIGVGEVEEQLGMSVDLAALSEVPVQLVVGNLDIGPVVRVPEDSEIWHPEIHLAGTTRLELARTLHAALQNVGVTVRLDILDEEAHHPTSAYDAFSVFIMEQLRALRS